MKIYVSSSWKNRREVRQLTGILGYAGHEVFDFTNQDNRNNKIVPPEDYPNQFDPEKHDYRTYLMSHPDWFVAVYENRRRIESCDCVVLLLPCGIDATADWAYGVGRGKRSFILGHPLKGERSPTHLWADHIFDNTGHLIQHLALLEKQ